MGIYEKWTGSKLENIERSKYKQHLINNQEESKSE